MPRPYSEDLRWRAIWMKEFLGYSVDEVAAALYMSPKTILRYVSKCLNSGEVKAESLGRPLNSFLIHPHVEFVIMEAVLDHPEKTLSEIAQNIYEQTGSEHALSSILLYLKRNRFSRKKDKRLKRTYGYSPIGKRAEVKHMAQNWGPRITAIPVICTEGMIDLGLFQGNVNGATFEDFVDEKLCPNLLPFNGINPRSVVIMGTRESLAPVGF